MLKKWCSILLVCLLLIGMTALSVSAADASITVSSVSADPGDTVTVTVSLSDNPGITVMRLQVEYDDAVLTLIDVQDSERLGKSMHSDNMETVPFVLYWNNATSKVNYRINGTVATLTFAVADDARYGQYEIGITCVPEDILNTYMDSVPFTITPGQIAVSCDHARADWRRKVPSTCLEKGTDALICRDCGKEMDTREIPLGRHTVTEWVIDKEATLTETGLRHGFCTVCRQDVTEEISKQVTSIGTTVSPDSATTPEVDEKDEVHITVDTDQETTLPGDVELTAKEVILYGKERKEFYQLVKTHYPEKTVAALYDIGLTLDGEPYVSNGSATVKIALSETIRRQYTDWQVILVDGETISSVEAVVKDGLLVFETDNTIGRYAILGKTIATDTEKSAWIWMVVACGVLCAGVAIIIIHQYRKKRAQK